MGLRNEIVNWFGEDFADFWDSLQGASAPELEAFKLVLETQQVLIDHKQLSIQEEAAAQSSKALHEALKALHPEERGEWDLPLTPFIDPENN